MFRIRIEKEAVRELDALRAFDRMRILEEIDAQLRLEPLGQSRRKKLLQGVEPPWDQVGPVRQLRIGDFRIFYDVDEPKGLVIVRAVRRKPPHKTTEDVL